MVYRHNLQSIRFELKYIVSEACARGIRDYIRPYLQLDEHALEEWDGAYPVFSLYLDTSSLALCGQTVQGLKNRFKLRVRFYDVTKDSPAFFEVKRRVTNVIRKERAVVTPEGVRHFLSGGRPNESHLVGNNGDGASGGSMQNFCDLCDMVRAYPSVYVSYVREAYVSESSNEIRVTFDRSLSGSRFEAEAGLVKPLPEVFPKTGGVILEMKFTNRFPTWMQEMAEVFNLQRVSVPKYVKCIDAMGIKPGQIQRPALRITP